MNIWNTRKTIPVLDLTNKFVAMQNKKYKIVNTKSNEEHENLTAKEAANFIGCDKNMLYGRKRTCYNINDWVVYESLNMNAPINNKRAWTEREDAVLMHEYVVNNMPIGWIAKKFGRTKVSCTNRVSHIRKKRREEKQPK